MKIKKSYLILIISVLILLIGVSFAYFSLEITGNDTAKYNTITTGALKLTFTDTNALTLTDALPGDSATKTISVKNTGTIDTSYNIVWKELTNTITNDELVIEATCKRLNSSNTEEGTCESIPQKAVSSNKLKLNIPIEPGITHEYTLKLTFIDTGSLQDYNKNKTFEGKLGITESSVKTVYCTYDGELTQGAEYVNGQYTYRYMQEGTLTSSGLAWYDMTSDGWGVQLTDKASTDAVTSKVCTYINNKPITSMSFMFDGSKATTLDVSNFDTSKVTNMYAMFSFSKATTLDVSNFDTSNVTTMYQMFSFSQATTLDVSNFNTSNVTNMEGMFVFSKATTLDVSNFDTSKVWNMGSMFSNSKATTLDVSNFNTSKVTNMNKMFDRSQATTLDLSNFDTSNVTYMSYMFYNSKATTLDVSNFNTSNVTDMSWMFYDSQATTLDVSNFDTSKVTNMSSMFSGSKATTLDLSNFNTSNVTDMGGMFSGSQATTLDVSNFDTSNVTNMSIMFSGSKATTLDLSNFNTSNVTDMSIMFNNSQATTLDVSNFDTSKVTTMSSMFSGSQATTLDVSNFNTSNVTDISYMFNNSQATTLDVSNFNTSNVTTMNGMFWDSKVTTIDLSNFDTSKVTSMRSMFDSSTNLKTIYVSNKFNTDKVAYSSSMFSGCTNLVGGAGTKYDSTKIDKTYARIDGGTSSPGYFTSIPEPNSFSSDSWMTIAKAVKSGNISKYNVGDTKTVNLGTYGTHTLRVANISKSDSCGNSGYSESGCGFVIEFADIITNRVINSTSTTKGSWSATTIRTFVNNDIYNLLPTDLKNGILNTNVITGHGNSEGNNSTSTDKLYLLSPIEIYGSVSTTYDSAINVTNQLDYYKQNNVSLNSYDSAIKNTVVSGGTGSASTWWTRTPAQMMDGQFMMVTNTGNLYSTYLTQQLGVSPAFRIG